MRITANPRSIAEMSRLLEALVQNSVAQRHAGLPPLSRAKHIRYRREPPGREQWQSARDTYELGNGDCEDLAIYLCADLRARGAHDARVEIIPVGPRMMHAVVRYRGKIWDPSRARGMGAHRRF